MAFGIWKGGINPFDPNSALRRWIEDTPLDLDLGKRSGGHPEVYLTPILPVASIPSLLDPNSALRKDVIENSPLDLDIGKHFDKVKWQLLIILIIGVLIAYYLLKEGKI